MNYMYDMVNMNMENQMRMCPMNMCPMMNQCMCPMMMKAQEYQNPYVKIKMVKLEEIRD